MLSSMQRHRTCPARARTTRRDRALFVLAAGFLVCGLLAASSVRAQQPQQQQQQQGDPAAAPEAPAAEAPAPANRPGFLETIGRWFGDSRAVIDSQVRSTQETLGTLGSQARDAAGTVAAMPGTRVITGRQLCPPATNGAPDCQQGVETLCRAKGFQSGRTLDIASSQRCPAKVWIAGRAPKEGECRMETYVTRAVCQ
jgi:hypothetical protein